MTLFVLLPAFNEEDSIPALVPKIFHALADGRWEFRVVLVDDGSTDHTRQRLVELRPEFPVEVLSHPINRGLGETIRDGIEYCVREGRPGDVVIRLDCDDTQDPAAIPALVEQTTEGYDVVLTSRYQPGGGQTGVYGYRKLLSWGAGIFMKAVFPIRGVRDYSSGYRAYRWEILAEAINVFGNRFIEQMDLGFSCTLEKLVKLHILGATFTEVPHVLRYDQKKSVSKMATWPTLWGYLVLACRYSPWIGVRRGHWRRRVRRLRCESTGPGHHHQEGPLCAESQAT